MWYPLVMKMFISIPIKKEMYPYIEKIQDTIITSSSKGIKSRLDQMHITLAFMNEVNKKQAVDLIEYLYSINLPSCTLECNHINTFIRPEGTLYYIEARKNDSLIHIQQEVRSGLTKLHIPFDQKMGPFHITIARKVQILREKLELDINSLPSMSIDFITLVESTLTQNGAIHIEKGKFPLLGKSSTLL